MKKKSKKTANSVTINAKGRVTARKVKTSKGKTATVRAPKTVKVVAPKKTIVAFLLDETGSMGGCKAATISGFNEYIKTLANEAGKRGNILFTLTKFNAANTVVVHSSIPVADVVQLNDENYQPNHNTPLYDAIGRTITDIDNTIKTTTDKPNVLFVIMTDGEENASREFNRQRIFDLIDARKKDGWEFIFLGANQDAYLAANSIGVGSLRTMNYSVTSTSGTMSAVATSNARYVKSGSLSSTQDFFTNAERKMSGEVKPEPKTPTTK